MANELGVGARRERQRRRRFWGTLAVLGVPAGVAGFVVGLTGAHTDWRTISIDPALAYLVVGAAIAGFIYGSWLFFKRVDEVEIADNLWASMLGFYAYGVLLPAWTLLWWLDAAPEPSDWTIYFASLFAGLLVYAWLKLRRR